MTQLNAFIAHSFDPQDERRIEPVLNFLGTFRKAGFICETAEASEVQSVSKKVRSMIDERDVFIGFLTARYPAYDFKSRIKDGCRLLLGRLKPNVWSAPAWVIQESGYALKGGKDLILLKEPRVDLPGLQGDLEYIPYDPDNPTAVFNKLSQMINDLLGKAAGTEVKTTVLERSAQAQLPDEAATAEAARAETPDTTDEADIVWHMLVMQRAAENGDLSAIDEAWGAGTDLISLGQTPGLDNVTWDCLYFEERFTAGASDAIEELRRIHNENPDRPEAPAALARCLENSEEFIESAELFLRAATLQEGEFKASSLVSAARGFRKTKQYDDAEKAVRQALPIATGKTKEKATLLLYKILRDRGDRYFAFATAESALQDNPRLSLRFTLALDYRRRDLNELGLFHFKYLFNHDKKDTSSLHNLALLYSECKLPISAVRHYKSAIEAGETHSAANLGFLYLESGMADEAKALVDTAMEVQSHNSQVEACLADIVRHRGQEEKRETQLLEQATAERAFFVEMGRALLAPPPSINGIWKFPFG